MTEQVPTPSHETIEHALGLWREGWKQTDKTVLSPAWRADYLAAVNAVLPMLQRYTTMYDLVRAYFASPPAVDLAIEHVIHSASDHILNFGIVEDAAYWLRVQQLQAAAGEQED